MKENFPLMDRFLQCTVTESTGAVPETVDGAVVPETVNQQQQQRHRKFRDAPPASRKKNDAMLRSQRSRPQSPKQQHRERHSDEHITGQLHHQHAMHFNADPNTEEGLTKLSWELVGAVLFLFCGVFLLWLRFALSPSKKSRKTS